MDGRYLWVISFAWVVCLWVFRQRVSVYATVQGMLVAIFISWVCINVSAYIHHCTSLVLPWNAFISFPLSVIMLWRMNRIKQRLKPQPTDARSRGTGLSSFKSCDEAYTTTRGTKKATRRSLGRSLGTGLPSFTTSHSNYDSRYRDQNRDRDRNRRNCKAFDPDSDSDFDFDRTGAPSLELLG